MAQKFNHPFGTAGGAKTTAKRPPAEQKEVESGQLGEHEMEPGQIAADHGPAHEVHVTHEHEIGSHHVHSIHPDGHEHHSDHGSAEEAHEHGKKLAGAAEPEHDEEEPWGGE